VSFRRLTPGHTLALVAALALLLAMAPDWYTDKTGEQDRYFQHRIAPQLNTQTEPSISQQQAEAAETHEKNAWQASGAIDRVILIGLLASAGLAIAAAFMRAAGRDMGPPSLSALASIVSLVTAALVAYRIIQPPGLNEAAVVKWGAPLGLVCVGVVSLGSRAATRREREPSPPAEAPAPAQEQATSS
jgi:peptidoglycan/LPS O-acetylase OafA/YrhL